MDSNYVKKTNKDDLTLAAEGVADFLRDKLRGPERGKNWTNDEMVFESIGKDSAQGFFPLDTRSSLAAEYIDAIRPKHPDIAEALGKAMDKQSAFKFYSELQNRIADFKYAAGLSAAGVEFFSWNWQSEIRLSDLRSSNPLRHFLLNEVNKNFDQIRRENNQDGPFVWRAQGYVRVNANGITSDDLSSATSRAKYPMFSKLR